jgi:hypothetical protein
MHRGNKKWKSKRDNLEDLEWVFENSLRRCELNPNGRRYYSVIGFCEYGDEALSSI